MVDTKTNGDIEKFYLHEAEGSLQPPCSRGRWPSTWPCWPSRCPAWRCCARRGRSRRKHGTLTVLSSALPACAEPAGGEIQKSLKREILAVCKSATLLPKAFLSLTQSRVSSNIASALANSSLAHPICGGYCMATKSPKSFLRIITSRCNWATYPLLGQLVHQIVETVVFFSQKSGFWEPQIFEEQLSSVLWMRYRRSRL